MAGVAAVVGNSHKALAPEIILGLARALTANGDAARSRSNLRRAIRLLAAGGRQAQVVWADDRFAHSFLEEAQLVPGAQTRPNLKIQEGCGNRCTFCVIPQTRGPSKKPARASVLRQVEGFVAAGGNELVLSGINLGRWGRDLAIPARHDATLAGLVREILEQTELPRLRLSSIEPMDWDAELIGLMAEFGGTRLARHAHLPLQSGSDAVLRRMHRRYRPWHYAEKVEALLRAAGPELTLGADVMVGFPGETDAEFEETLALMRALPFGYLHLFPFSPRPGTPGWALHAEQPVPPRPSRSAWPRYARWLRKRAARTEGALSAGSWRRSRCTRRRSLQPQGRTAALTRTFLPVELEGRLEANRLVAGAGDADERRGRWSLPGGQAVAKASSHLPWLKAPASFRAIGAEAEPMLYSVCVRVPAAIPADPGGGQRRLLEEHHRTRQTFGKVLYPHQRKDSRARNPRHRRKRRTTGHSCRPLRR